MKTKQKFAGTCLLPVLLVVFFTGQTRSSDAQGTIRDSLHFKGSVIIERDTFPSGHFFRFDSTHFWSWWLGDTLFLPGWKHGPAFPFSGPFGKDSLRWHEWFRSHARSLRDSSFHKGFVWPGFPELHLDFWSDFTFDTIYWRHRLDQMLNNPEIFREELLKTIEEARQEMERYLKEYRMKSDTLYYPGDEDMKLP